MAYFVRAFYDSAHGLADRLYLENYEKKEIESANRPLAMVSMNTREGLMELDGFGKRFAEYTSYGVLAATGMSFDKWISQSTSRIETQLTILRHQFQQREAETERARKEAEDQRLNGPRDPQAVAMEQLAGGSRYKP